MREKLCAHTFARQPLFLCDITHLQQRFQHPQESTSHHPKVYIEMFASTNRYLQHEALDLNTTKRLF
ncbi:MAG: hypothetical protein CL920_37535 [Deltaproteobacteria bacterium]|nr:hypothetical protein [Deltaproteobacteria bacterium]MBU54434.1 hypothetical protein [Deltaproteobacteria bacterium]